MFEFDFCLNWPDCSIKPLLIFQVYSDNLSKLSAEIGGGIKLRVLLPAVINAIDTLLDSSAHGEYLVLQ